MPPQPHTADVYRAKMVQRTAQEIDGYKLLYEQVSCFVQPMSSKEAFYYMERGLENLKTVYTVRTDLTYKRKDILEVNGEQLHVVGVQDGCQLGVYIQLDCEQFPEEGRKRLNREAYEA